MIKKHQIISLDEVLRYDDFIFGLCAFLDDFKRSNDKYNMIKSPPKLENIKLNKKNACILAAVVHKLANDYKVDVPAWVNDSMYKMPYPVFEHDTKNAKYQEFLKKDAPAEFAEKNIFYGSRAIGRV